MAVDLLVHRPARIPVPLTSLVGRQREIAAVADKLRRPDVRLVTLTGPGGVGKTRLAIAVASETESAFVGGAVFVPLAAVREPGLVLPAIARALGVQEVHDRPLAVSVAAALGVGDALLVLDNFEHLLDAAPAVAELLAAAPALTALVTSRSPLGISGEHAAPVSPLAIPPIDLSVGADAIAGVDAVALFVARAEAADPAFALNDANAATVAAICDRLDGLPLAIELAAARVPVLSPAALLARLTDRLRLLIGGPRDQPPRLRSLRDAIAWSHDLLTPQEQALFRRLAVFSGGWTLDAAEAVCAEPGLDVLEGMAALGRQSLVRRLEPAGEEPRFGMLETIRELALDQLTASGEAAAVSRAHAAFYLEVAKHVGAVLRGENEGAWLDRLEAELPNLRACLARVEAHGEVAAALGMAGSMQWFWHMRGDPGEGRAWLERALAMHPAAPSAERAKALDAAGLLAWHQGDDVQAAMLAHACLALGRQVGEPTAIAGAQRTLGLVAVRQGRYEEGRALHEESLARFRSLGDRFWIALSLLNLAVTARDDRVRRRDLQQEALKHFRNIGSQWGTARALTELGRTVMLLGDLAAGIAYVREGLALSSLRRDRWQMTFGLEILAEGLVAGGNPERAAFLLGAAVGLRESTGVTAPLILDRGEEPVAVVARAQLREQRFVAAWKSGKALTLEQVVAEALAVAEEASAGRELATDLSHGLTPRELDTLRLVVEGRTNREIAASLYITERTARAHVASILAKLGVPTRAAAAAYALRHHLV